MRHLLKQRCRAPPRRAGGVEQHHEGGLAWKDEREAIPVDDASPSRQAARDQILWKEDVCRNLVSKSLEIQDVGVAELQPAADSLRISLQLPLVQVGAAVIR